VIALEAEDLTVHTGPERDGILEYRCPACGRLNLRRLAPNEVELLAGVGIGRRKRAERFAPLELLERRTGPPFTWDDLLDFHQQLAVAHDVATLWSRDGEREPVTSTIANERHAA
jgi:hypothetical protein